MKELIENQVKMYLSEGRFHIPKTKISGTFYHGSAISNDDYVFDEFDSSYSDWGAVWLADDESVAEEFSDRFGTDDGEYRIVFAVSAKLNAIADISNELVDEIVDMWGIEDIREAIPLLQQKGYNGWELSGSLDLMHYNDIAIFYPEDINILKVKMFVNDDWTDYMEIDDANGLLNSLRNN